MENAAKALEIAAGVLLAVLIMSLIAFFFTNLSSWPEEEDSMQTAEQLAKFNLEYEVYDKKGMYGTDVISCLTKAQSNNEKYALGGKYLSGSRYGEDYWIDVYVNLKSDLTEQVTVYYYNKNAEGINSQQIQFTNAAKDTTMGEAGFVFDSSVDGNSYTLFTPDTPLDPTDSSWNNLENVISADTLPGKAIDLDVTVCTHKGKTYNAQLYDTSSILAETPLQILIDTAGKNLKQIVRNPDAETLEKWSSAEWQTALYDFKTRRFKCDDIEYSDITGRVNKIYFSEI